MTSVDGAQSRKPLRTEPLSALAFKVVFDDHGQLTFVRVYSGVLGFTVAALMAPEVYMSLNNIAFTDRSVSSDRDAVAECFCPEDVESIRQNKRDSLADMFQCPHVLAAISIFSAHMYAKLREHGEMSGISIHEIIDPILMNSPYADGLREKLNG